MFLLGGAVEDAYLLNYQYTYGSTSHILYTGLTEHQAALLSQHPNVKSAVRLSTVGTLSDPMLGQRSVKLAVTDRDYAQTVLSIPTTGRLPEQPGEIALDEFTMGSLGVLQEIGAPVTLEWTDAAGNIHPDAFTLCGWWEYDEAIVANHILIPESRVDAILAEVGVTPTGSDGMTGSWNLDVMLKNGARSISSDLETILENHGYQSESMGENHISIGINWGYTGAQLSDKLDPAVVALIAGVLLLILLTGYLIIYNVFQISVAGDIRYYGLLKAIGTTPRQLRRIIRIQALLLSLIGIPVGLLLGWLLGGVLTPVIVAQLDGVTSVVSVSPLLFVGSALFALVTVLISCRRPGHLAGRVSPVEAVRYTEGKALKRKGKRSGKGVSLLSMAWANLGRSRGKTFLTVLSLTLAVVLLTLTVTFTGGFDMDKYVSSFTASDFILADAGQFQTGGDGFNSEMAVPEAVISAVDTQEGITGSGRVYGKTAPALEFVTEEYYRSVWGRWNTQEQMDSMIAFMDRTEDGLLADRVQLYGMEPFALNHLTVLEGDLAKLNDPDGNYIAAVYSEDDYGNPEMDSHWARLGDTVTIRYVEEYEYYDPASGQVYGPWENVPEGAAFAERAVQYRDVDYTVAALVVVPSALSYRYYGADEFVMGAETFIRDTGTDSVMYYAFDTTEEANAAMESFLQDYTENVNPQFDYESKATYAGEFESTRSMFLLLGGALSFIVGLVGVLNFFNAILTGITARRRELAVLQSIGMTARQLRTMLALEGLFYTLGAALLALVLVVVTAPVVGPGLSGFIWFFTYHFTIWPIAVVLPLFAALGILIPVLSCRASQRYSVVERLRVE